MLTELFVAVVHERGKSKRKSYAYFAGVPFLLFGRERRDILAL